MIIERPLGSKCNPFSKSNFSASNFILLLKYSKQVDGPRSEERLRSPMDIYTAITKTSYQTQEIDKLN